MHDAFATIGLVALGFVVSLMSGFFGVGGGWIITPALNVFGMPMPYAVGTSFLYIFGAGAMGIIRHRRRGNTQLSLGIVIGVAMIAGIEAGKRAVLSMEKAGSADAVVRGIYIALLLGLGLFMVLHTAFRRRAGDECEPVDGPRSAMGPGPFLRLESGARVSIWLPVLMGLAAGVLSGLMGVGGGFALVPAMIYILGLPTVSAVGTSLVCVALAGAYGAAAYGLAGRVFLWDAICLLAGAIPGIPLGVMATGKIAPGKLRMLYALVLIGGGISVVLKQAGLDRAAMGLIMGCAGLMGLIIIWFALTGKKPDCRR